MRILLADDHHLVREALASYLASKWPETFVSEASSLADALQRVSDNELFDIILLDLWMPGMNGVEGVDGMLRAAPGVPIVLVSSEKDWAVAMEAIDHGARGIITKHFKGQTMINAIDLIVSGEKFVPSAMTQRALADQDCQIRTTGRMRVSLGGLSEREYEITSLLAKGLNNKQIGNRIGITEGTVKLHLSHVFEKSGARNRADAVRLYFEAKVMAPT